MKRRITFPIGLLLSVIILFSFLPVIPLAADVQEMNFANGSVETGFEAPLVTKSTKAKKLMAKAASSLPEKYDGREYNYIPSVKNQGDDGTCWAFSLIGSAEMNLIKKGLADVDKIDLSELQLVYFTYNTPDDPLGNYTGDKVYKSDGNILNLGSTDYAVRVAERWNAFADEDLMPYTEAAFATEYEYPDEMATGYSKYRMDNLYTINFNQPEEIKKCIYEYGSVVTSYYSLTNGYSKDTISAYQNQKSNVNHAISIVGWDDNYPVSKFNSSMRPSSNGAWLVRNSWGTDFHDNGYFWLSYEDLSIKGKTAYAFDMGLSDDYDYNYAFDGGVATYTISADAMSNTFTAKHNETIEAVMVDFPITANVNYNVRIFVNKGSSTNLYTTATQPDSEQNGTTYYAGSHTIKLDKPVKVKKGDTFTVVVGAKASDGTSKAAFAFDATTEYTTSFAINKPSYDPAVSYMYSGSTRYDLRSGIGISTGSGTKKVPATPRIKAFTNEDKLSEPEGFDASLSGNEVTLTWSPVTSADSYQIWSAVENSDYKLLKTTGKTSYTYTENPENGLSVRYKVKALNGTQESNFSNADAIRFPIVKHINSFSLYNFKVEAGKTADIPYAFTPSDASDKFVYYKSSDENVAKITADGKVIGVSAGSATITGITRDGVKKASCTVTVDNHKHTLYVSKTAKAATCGEDGYTEEKSCSTCNSVVVESTIVYATGEHNGVTTKNAEAATCVNAGWTEEISCSVCKTILKASQTVDPTGKHSEFTSKEGKAATCAEDGFTAETRCRDCGSIIRAMKTIPATGKHTEYVSRKAQSPTCAAAGWTEEISCSVCNAVIKVSQTINSTGKHTEYVSKKATASTCVKAGLSEEISCSVCNRVMKAQTKLPLAEHKPYVSVAEKKATCTESGYTAEEKCTVCQRVLTESKVIASDGKHADKNGDKLCDNCGTKLSQKCSCNCHKNGFAGFLWKIVNLFNKIFKINQICNCGVKHW